MKNTQIKVTDCETTPCPLCGAVETRLIAQGMDTEYGTSELAFTFVDCKKCLNCYLNPRPRMDAAHLMYPGDYYTLAGRHGKKGSHLIATLKRRIIQRRLAFFNELFMQKKASVLEVGCGDCALLIELKKTYPQLACTGVDLSFGKEHQQECQRLGITLMEQAVENVQLQDRSYDLVIMNQIIEHLWSPLPVLQKLAAALRPGGLISIETVNLDGYDRRIFADGEWGGYYFPRHLNLFSHRTLSTLLEQNGFRVVRSYSLLAPIIWVFSLRAYLAKHFGSLPRIRRFLSDKNPLCLAIFTLIDTIALLFKKTTSNQKIIAKKI